MALLAGALDDLVATGAMPPGRRAGAETIAWSAVHGFAVLRAGHAFEASGEHAPDPEGVLDAIARSLELTATSRPRAVQAQSISSIDVTTLESRVPRLLLGHWTAGPDHPANEQPSPDR